MERLCANWMSQIASTGPAAGAVDAPGAARLHYVRCGAELAGAVRVKAQDVICRHLTRSGILDVAIER